eukprot:gene1776-33195_t
MASEQRVEAIPSVRARRGDREEYYAEESFRGADLVRNVHVGWGVAAGTFMIVFCMGMSGVTQGRSWNVSFRWLQRRVGAQFGTVTYMVTTNLLYYHDGAADKWVTRDWAQILSRWDKKVKKAPTFAASGLQ